MEFVTLK